VHDHDGPGESCFSCARLLAVRELLRQLSIAAAAAFMAAFVRMAAERAPMPSRFGGCSRTLIGLKVRLNN
jgi:hypothetical protein